MTLESHVFSVSANVGVGQIPINHQHSIAPLNFQFVFITNVRYNKFV